MQIWKKKIVLESVFKKWNRIVETFSFNLNILKLMVVFTLLYLFFEQINEQNENLYMLEFLTLVIYYKGLK